MFGSYVRRIDLVNDRYCGTANHADAPLRGTNVAPGSTAQTGRSTTQRPGLQSQPLVPETAIPGTGHNAARYYNITGTDLRHWSHVHGTPHALAIFLPEDLQSRLGRFGKNPVLG